MSLTPFQRTLPHLLRYMSRLPPLRGRYSQQGHLGFIETDAVLASVHAAFVAPIRNAPYPPLSVVKDPVASFQPSTTIAETTPTFTSKDAVVDVLHNGADVTSSLYGAT